MGIWWPPAIELAGSLAGNLMGPNGQLVAPIREVGDPQLGSWWGPSSGAGRAVARKLVGLPYARLVDISGKLVGPSWEAGAQWGSCWALS